MSAEQVKRIGENKFLAQLETFELPNGEKIMLRRKSAGAIIMRQLLNLDNPQRKILLSQVKEIVNTNTKDNSRLIRSGSRNVSQTAIRLAEEKLKKSSLEVISGLNDTLRKDAKSEFKMEIIYSSSSEGKPVEIDRAYYLGEQDNSPSLKRGRKPAHQNKTIGLILDAKTSQDSSNMQKVEVFPGDPFLRSARRLY